MCNGQARAFRLRRALLGLHSWAKLSLYWRTMSMKASVQAKCAMLQACFKGWKATIFPSGMGSKRGPTACGNRGIHGMKGPEAQSLAHGDEKLGGSTQETQHLGMIEATSTQSCGSPFRASSLDMLRLPMVGRRMRRILCGWRKVVKKGKRHRYIRDMLPQKVGLFPLLFIMSRRNLKTYTNTNIWNAICGCHPC